MKFNCVKLVFSVFVIFALCEVLRADLPVHCLKSQIVGEWTIQTTPTKEMNREELYKLTCGHTLPSHESNAYKSVFSKDKYTKNLKIELLKSDQATITYNENKKIGKWTMVYDEGFDIIIGDMSFFAFNMYSPRGRLSGVPGGKKKWDSKCFATLNGWYHIGNAWGCFIAHKNDVDDPYKVTNGEASDKNIVLEGVIKSKNEISKTDNELKSIDKMIANISDNEDHNTEEVKELSSNLLNFVETKFRTRSKARFSNKNLLKLDTSFKGHAEVVERINSMNLSWKAHNHEQFADMTIEQLNKYSGRNKKKSESLLSYSSKTEKHKKFKKSKKVKRSKKSSVALNTISLPTSEADSDYKDLPKEHLKWKPYVTQVYSQKNCGSCYILSTLAMLKARLEIKAGIKEEFSIDHVINCSVTNQGCDGGYSYLVSKFGSDIEIIPKSCEAPRLNGKFQCKKDCKGDEKKQKRSIKTKDYKFVGGSYGKSSEETMMRDIMENGPTVCSFSPGYAFNLYKEGVYNTISAKTWKMLGLSKPQWTKVEHSVLCIGWGVDEKSGLKYWLALNSWGQNWGDKGFFKIRRGVDLEGIESIGESSIPYIEE